MTTEHYSPTQFARTSDSCRAEESRGEQAMRFPTSPWTEAYQAVSHSDMQAADYELQPTRDALSDIYNRGYSD
ncbi:MAG: hypothetical protein U0670_00970 [Anaerolineae bacterium]